MSEGIVVTFYSYKGGVGRTFILANVATLLSQWGYRVLCIDWDLEAPGLSHYFSKFMPPGERPGLLEWIQSYAGGSLPDWRSYCSPLIVEGAPSQLQFMPAGLRNDSYVGRVQEINWSVLYNQNRFGVFLEEARDQWKQEFDFVLVDSRTGISDSGGICTVQLPDILAPVLTANRQSLEGVLEVAAKATSQRRTLPFDRAGLKILPILSRFDTRVERELSQAWLTEIEQKLEPFFLNWIHRSISPPSLLQTHIRIPYFSYWSFGEELPVLKEKKPDSESISYSLETLTALIASGLSDTQVLADSRDIYVGAAKRRGGSQRLKPEGPFESDIYISSAGEDAEFVKLVSKFLAESGLVVYAPESEHIAPVSWADHFQKAVSRARTSRHAVLIIGDVIRPEQGIEAEMFLKSTFDDATLYRRLIPVVRKKEPKSLPSYFRNTQLLDARDMTPGQLAQVIVRMLKPSDAEDEPWGIRPRFDPETNRTYLTGQQLFGWRKMNPDQYFVPVSGAHEIKLDKWYRLEKMPNKDAYWLEPITTIDGRTNLALLSELQSEHGIRRRAARQAIDEMLQRGVRISLELKSELLKRVLDQSADDQERAGCMTLLHAEQAWDLGPKLINEWLDPQSKIQKTLSSRLVTFFSDLRNGEGLLRLLATLGSSTSVSSLHPERLADILSALSVRLDTRPLPGDAELDSVKIQATRFINHGEQQVQRLAAQIVEKLKG